jgi:hypothetical protein
MTIALPYASSEFADLLLYTSVRIWLDEQQDISGDGHGNYFTVDLGPRIWRGEVTLAEDLTHADAAKVQALVEALDGAMGTFYLYDPRLPYPIDDPLGAIIKPWSGTVTISAVRNNKEIQATGLPPNYLLQAGDRVAFNFGSSPTHRAYHRIVAGDRANSSGNTTWMELRPLLRDADIIGRTLTIEKPAALWCIPPGQFKAGAGRKTLTPGGSFQIQQVI